MKKYRNVCVLKGKKIIPKGKDPAPYGIIQVWVFRWQMQVTIVICHSN